MRASSACYHFAMNSREAKKLRKLYRRDYRDVLRGQIDETAALLAQQIKPKPQWMPNWVYHWCMTVVLK